MSMRENRNLLTRRDLLKRAAVASAGVVGAPMINRGRFRLFAHSATVYSARTIDLIERTTVIDMLGVFAISPAKTVKWFSNPDNRGADPA